MLQRIEGLIKDMSLKKKTQRGKAARASLFLSLSYFFLASGRELQEPLTQRVSY
jgi:hypothetical protein